MGIRHALARLDDLIVDDLHRLDRKVVGAPPPLPREVQRALRARERQAQTIQDDMHRQAQQAKRRNDAIAKAHQARVRAYAKERGRR